MATTSQRHYIDITVDAGRAARQLRSIDRNLGRTARAARGMQTSFQRLNATLGILAGAHIMGSLLKGAVRMVDSYNELGGRINLVAESTVGLAKAQEDLNTIAMSTYTSYDAVSSLYARLGMSMKGLGATHEQLAAATETVANTLRLSGASAQEARSSMLQLSQSMASGVLAGDEYRSISENNVALMDLLSESLNVTRGELKKMSKDGLLTTAVVFKALTKNTEKYRDLVKGLPITMSRAFTNLETAWQRLLVASSSEDSGLTGAAESIDEFAKALNSPQVREGIATLISGVVNIGRVALTAVNGLVQLAQLAGGGFGYMEMSAEINTMSASLSKLREESNNLQNGLNKNWYAGADRIAEITDRVAGLKDEYDTLLASMNRLKDIRDMTSVLPEITPLELTKPGDFLGEDGATGNTGTKKLSDLDKYRQSLLDAEKAVDLFFQKQSLLNDMMISGAIGTDTGAEALDKLSPALEKVTSNIDAYIESVKDIDRAEEFWWEQQEALVGALNRGDISLMAFDKSMENLGVGIDNTVEKTATMSEAIGGMLADSIGDFSDSIIDFALTGKESFADMTKSMLSDIAKLILKMQILNALKASPYGSFLGLANADGNVFQNGAVLPFANGGVVSSPTVFPMANGGIGLMGEAGPEAIMPLTRRNGKLGVEGGGSQTNVIINNNASGTEITTEETPNGNGGLDVQVFIENSVNKFFESGGADRMMGATFGGRRVPR